MRFQAQNFGISLQFTIYYRKMCEKSRLIKNNILNKRR